MNCLNCKHLKHIGRKRDEQRSKRGIPCTFAIQCMKGLEVRLKTEYECQQFEQGKGTYVYER